MHEIIKQSKRELFGTPEHDRVKQAQCVKRAELFGTPEHDRIKWAKCTKRAELFGTDVLPEHEGIDSTKTG